MASNDIHGAEDDSLRCSAELPSLVVPEYRAPARRLPMADMKPYVFYSPLGRYGLASADFGDRFRLFMIAIAESVEGITSTNSKPSSAAF